MYALRYLDLWLEIKAPTALGQRKVKYLEIHLAPPPPPWAR